MRTGLTVNIKHFLCPIFIGVVCCVENRKEWLTQGLISAGIVDTKMTISLTDSRGALQLRAKLHQILSDDGRSLGLSVIQFSVMISYFRVKNKKGR